MNAFVNQVIEGDCLDILPTLKPGSIDMVLCDLPYGTTRNRWDIPIDMTRLWQCYDSVVKKGGVIALMAQGRFTAQVIVSNLPAFRYKIVWIKSAATGFLNARKEPLRKHEDICIFYTGVPTYHPQMTPGKPYNKGVSRNKSDNYNNYAPSAIRSDSGLRYPADIVQFEPEHQEDYIYCKSAPAEGKVYHATQKPVALGRYLVRTYTNAGDIILDNTCGSGSFLVAAVLENRGYIGIEKNGLALTGKHRGRDLISICRERITAAIKQRDNNLLF